MQKSYLLTALCFLFFFGGNAQQNLSETGNNPQPGRFFIRPGAGMFFKLAGVDESLPPTVKEHAKNLRNGFVWGIDGGYMISENDYLGLTFSTSKKSGEFDLLTNINPITPPIPVKVNNTESIRYTGLYYGNRRATNPNNTFFFHYKGGIGLWNYKSEFTSSVLSEDFKASNIGFQLGLGIEALISPKVGWMLDTDLLTGNVEIEGEKENLGQIRLTTGFVFRF
jgi:hypothetical protein